MLYVADRPKELQGEEIGLPLDKYCALRKLKRCRGIVQRFLDWFVIEILFGMCADKCSIGSDRYDAF
jgi:hypothetical protein